MYAQYGVRQATADEVKVFNKVDDRLTDELVDLVFDEELVDLLHNRIKNDELMKAIKSLGLTVEEVCLWYFMN